jgi:hypothetical protein
MDRGEALFGRPLAVPGVAVTPMPSERITLPRSSYDDVG